MVPQIEGRMMGEGRKGKRGREREGRQEGGKGGNTRSVARLTHSHLEKEFHACHSSAASS